MFLWRLGLRLHRGLEPGEEKLVKPLPWSHTALDDFTNCPRAYHAKRVVKSVKEEPTEALLWGNRVHKAFELRLLQGTSLPAELAMHDTYLKGLSGLPGVALTEQQIALDRSLQPCAWFGERVWFRGVIDYIKLNEPKALVVDYKTGKMHNKFGQLKLFALYVFAQHRLVDEVEVRYYWTQTHTATKAVYTRDQIPRLWAEFTPQLKQYADAFRTDTWQPRQSGLCNGWCPVQSCEFWKPRRV